MRSTSVASTFSLLVGLLSPLATCRSSQPLAFQTETNNNIQGLSFDTWSDIQNSPSGHGSVHLMKPLEPVTLQNSYHSVSTFSSEIDRDINLAFERSFSLSSVMKSLAKSFASLGFATNPFSWLHHSAPPIDLSKYTIGEVLNWTLHHPPKSFDGEHPAPPLYRLAWLVNLSQPIQEVLSDPKADLTLFAPDDKALTPPSKRHPHADRHASNQLFEGAPGPQGPVGEANNFFWEAIESIENKSKCPHMNSAEFTTNGNNWDSKKKVFLKVILAVLKYHVSPGSKTIHEILDSSTLPTALKISCEPSASKFRVRVGAPPPFIKPGEVALNFFSRIDTLRTRPILTKNGIVYIVHRVPLIPPLSPLSQLFLFPRPFSTLTSAIQKVRLDDQLLPHHGNKSIPLAIAPVSNDDTGSLTNIDVDLDAVDERVQSVLASLAAEREIQFQKRSFTVFAPTNRAFRSLGPHANAFLFSPFGAHILRYVLSCHLVPDIIWHTDHTVNVSDFKSIVTRYETDTYFPQELMGWASLPESPPYAKFHPRLPTSPVGKVNVTELSLPTLLGSRKNESLSISLVEFRHLGKGPIARRVYIKQAGLGKGAEFPNKKAIPVVVPDAVAWGGAIHVIPQLIRPPIPEGHKHRKDVLRAFELSLFSVDEE